MTVIVTIIEEEHLQSEFPCQIALVVLSAALSASPALRLVAPQHQQHHRHSSRMLVQLVASAQGHLCRSIMAAHLGVEQSQACPQELHQQAGLRPQQWQEAMHRRLDAVSGVDVAVATPQDRFPTPVDAAMLAVARPPGVVEVALQAVPAATVAFFMPVVVRVPLRRASGSEMAAAVCT